MSSFSGEYLRRAVVDANGELFGHLSDIVIDPRSGEVTEILVEVVPEIPMKEPDSEPITEQPPAEATPLSEPTTYTEPVIKEAFCEDRNTTKLETSLGVPKRFIATLSCNIFANTCLSV